MALPRAVQDQLDQAAALEKQLTGAPAEPQATPTQTEPAAGATPPAEPVAPVTPQSPAVAPADDQWEQKYKTLRGMYDADVPRLHAQVRELTQQVAQLQEAAKAKAETPAAKPAEPLVTEQDREAFGGDLVDLQERIARSVAAPLEDTIRQLKDRLEKYEGTAETVARQQQLTAEDRYFERLQTEVPDWEQINADQNWIDWLKGRYPGSAQNRQAQLDAARAALDIATTVEMFKAFKELTAAPQQANQNQLARQVSPSTSKGSPQPATPPAKKVWTQAEIAQALDPRALRSMTPQEVERVMSEIDLAAAEGRIR